ncbi:hypothetical protein EDB81DRAFT_105217 [Dactylonectria macrodidyma]|uniref:Uncharacterized protein n=1 Tax=Dactylonectria macrodidyma TaxID=307937 RepID=A0A9P9IU65_9HYPO|nr:hypothetical protein EDB81DRAFT_105217 [Dactylonectria macrodidyma]
MSTLLSYLQVVDRAYGLIAPRPKTAHPGRQRTIQGCPCLVCLELDKDSLVSLPRKTTSSDLKMQRSIKHSVQDDETVTTHDSDSKTRRGSWQAALLKKGGLINMSLLPLTLGESGHLSSHLDSSFLLGVGHDGWCSSLLKTQCQQLSATNLVQHKTGGSHLRPEWDPCKSPFERDAQVRQTAALRSLFIRKAKAKAKAKMKDASLNSARPNGSRHELGRSRNTTYDPSSYLGVSRWIGVGGCGMNVVGSRAPTTADAGRLCVLTSANKIKCEYTIVL